MLIKASSHQDTPCIILPFVLQIGTPDSDLLVDRPIVSHNLIVQVVHIIFCTCREFCWQEKELIHSVCILSTSGEGLAIRLAKAIRILPSTGIVGAVDDLTRRKDIEVMLAILGKDIEVQTARVDFIVCLFTDVRLVYRQVELVSTS